MRKILLFQISEIFKISDIKIQIKITLPINWYGGYSDHIVLILLLQKQYVVLKNSCRQFLFHIIEKKLIELY